MTLLLTFSKEMLAQRLSYILEPGTHYLMELSVQQNTRSESTYAEEISMYNRLTLGFRVDSTAPGGMIHMSVRYSGLLLSMLAPGMGLDINSGSGKNPMLTELVEKLEQGVFRVAMTPSGELAMLDGLDTLLDSLGDAVDGDREEQDVILKTLDEAYGPAAFRSLFSLFLTYFPSVQPIQNWTRDFTFFLNSKPVQMSNRYYLGRTTEEMMIIQGIGMINSTGEIAETTTMGMVSSSVSGSQTYDIHVHRDSGWLLKCVSRQRVLVETTILESPHFPSGLKIPSFTETLYEVNGSLR